VTPSDTLIGSIHLDTDAIEHALHTRRLVDLGLRTDDEVRAAIIAVMREAGGNGRAVAALAARDYGQAVDDGVPAAFVRRRQAALWRACQLHRCEDLYWQLAGLGREVPAPVLEQLGCLDPGCPSTGPYDSGAGLPLCIAAHADPDPGALAAQRRAL